MDTTELDGGGEHIAPLSSDSVPDANQAHYCFSCEAPIQGLYCASCGQKNDNYRRSIFSLFMEVFQSFTALESRIWRTWGTLLIKPGKVAREFADGRRTYWSSPVRVYLAMSILLFGFLNITQMQLITIDLDVKPIEGIEKPIDELTAEELKIVPAIHFFETRKRINARNATRNFDLIAKKIEGDDGIKIDFDSDEALDISERIDEFAAENENLSDEGKQKRQETSENLKTTATVNGGKGITFSSIDGKVYQLDSWSGIALQFVQNPQKLNAAFYKYLPRILFLMMPFTMLIGVIFIRGRGNALMYDHLVHAAYIHAVAFFILFVGIVLGLIWPGNPAPGLLLIAMIIYLPLSLKRMFVRGWIKTVWTSYGVGFIYAFNLALIMIILLLAQLISTVTEIGTPLTP